MRPFTLGQLKELLSRTGTLVEDGFWIDKIKSHCYVTVSFLRHLFCHRERQNGWNGLIQRCMIYIFLSLFSTVALMRQLLHEQLFME